jgi:LemA protein
MEFLSGVLLMIGIGFLYYNRSISKENFFFRRAPQLQINQVHTFDDGWFTGVIDTATILHPPFFNNDTVSYHYSLYEKVIKYEKDSQGRSKRVETWELYSSASDSTAFYLDDGSGKLIINPNKAIHKYPYGNSWESEHWKHVVSYIPSSGIISSVGVVSEDKKELIAKGETPFMISPMGRPEFMKASKSEEKWSKIGGLSFLWLSSLSFFYFLNESSMQIPLDSISLFILLGLMSTIPFAACYVYFTNNSLVALRAQVVNSWANVDVELKNRRDLIPNLVQTVGTYLKHEQNSFAKLSDLRASLEKENLLTSRIKIENKITNSVNSFLTQVESHPEFKDESVLLLQKELVIIENKISHAKSHFNAVAEEYNNLVEGMPSSFVANYFKYVSIPFYGDKNSDLMNMGKAIVNKASQEKIALAPQNPISMEQEKEKIQIKKAS